MDGPTDAIDSGRKPGLTTDERGELVEARRRIGALDMENETLKHASAYSRAPDIRASAKSGGRALTCIFVV